MNIELDLEIGRIINKSTEEEIIAEAIPDNLMVYIKMGGLVPYLESQLIKKD